MARVCTNFLPGARNSNTVLDGDVCCSVSTQPGVLSKAEVIIRAQVNHILHYPICVPGREREEDNKTEEAINERRLVFASVLVHLMTGAAN